jgi:type IV pilus assembly protein PilY1
MSNRMSPCDRAGALRRQPKRMRNVALAFAALLAAAAPFTALPATDLSPVPLPTYTVGSTVDIKPNILMVLDDSGSMDWDYLPDWANDLPNNYTAPATGSSGSDVAWVSNEPHNPNLPPYLYFNAAFNGVAYNPAVVYSPPLMFNNAGAKDTTTYPSMTAANTSNWTGVLNDGYKVQTTGSASNSAKTSLVDNHNAYFYTAQAGEYCDSPALTNCVTRSAPVTTDNFSYPAPLRWCSDQQLTNCRGLQSTTYKYPRMPAPRIVTLTITAAGNSGGSITGITVDSKQIMSATASVTSNAPSTLATNVATQINNCRYSLPTTTNCTVVGYFAVATGGTVNIYAPGIPGAAPTLTTGSSGSVTASFSTGGFARASIPLPDFFAGGTRVRSTNPVPGENLRTVLTSTVTSYPYPGTAAKAAGRSDCAGTTCTYAEEMTNYANWWAYYRTRMQMMKTATSRAFGQLDTDADITAGTTRYRVGFLTINNNTGGDFVNVTDFTASQKFTWFTQLFKANPGSNTPLRSALATAGQLYGGVMNGNSFRGKTVTDPLQFSCQKNYTILSTDGYWNTNTNAPNGGVGSKLDGSTPVGNQDGALPRPYNDGANAQVQARTSSLQKRTQTQMAQKGTLQKQVSQLQASTSTLQIRTTQLQIRTSNNTGSTWSGWSATSSCTPDSSGKNQTQCQEVGITPYANWTNISSCTSGQSGSTITSCQYTGWTTPADATSCAAVNQSGGPNYTVGTARQCTYRVYTAYATAASCAPTTTPDANGRTTQCQYSFAASAATQTCAPAYVANDFSNATVYANCTQTSSQAWNNVTSCAVTAPASNGTYTACQYSAWSGWSNVGSCTPLAQDTGPNYTVGTAKECNSTISGGTAETLADVAAYYYNTDLRDATQAAPDKTGSCTGPVISPSTTANDLCANNVPAFGRDSNPQQHMTTHTLGLGATGMMVFSQYQNNAGARVYVPDYWQQPSGDFYDVANGSTANPTSGICPWQTAGTTCTWPTPASDSPANIDDLWHAAVNGHGTYFSAGDPAALADALTRVLGGIVNTPRPGTAAAAASSNPNITSSDNYVFSSSYKSVDWFGELIMQQFNADGTLTPQQWSAMRLLDCATTPWTASRNYAVGDVFNQGGACYLVTSAYQAGSAFASGSGTDGSNTAVLTGTPVTRKIYTVGASGLVDFDWPSLNSTQQSYFSTPYISSGSATGGLSQFCSTGASCLGAATQTSASGQALVNYLKGDRSNEGTIFRARPHILGDIVSSEARYVKVPLQNYSDAGYLDFQTAMANRAPTVYVGSNDGMLHAFNALTGMERWAFVPSAVLPNIYHLADMNYSDNHRYFVDGTPEAGDICPKAPTQTCSSTEWKTILVGGLNQGGKSFYAMDITDPASPKLMWEFTNTNLGYAYGNPRITKLSNGTWVVIVASGYNNADGFGHVFTINASTGALISDISNGAGSSASPSGLARIAARSTTASTNNTVEQVYGGDLLGNVWRFDVNGTIGNPGLDAQLLVNLQDASGNAQPITAKPTVASINNFPLVIVGTGRYLGVSDLSDTKTYSMYGIKDPLTGTTGNLLPTPRSTGSNFVKQTMTETTCPSGAPSTTCTPGQVVRTSTANPVDWSTRNGWYLDFVLGGERSVTDATLALGTLVFTTVKPQSATASQIQGCNGADNSINAKSYLYYLDYLSGGAVEGTKNVVGEELCTCIATRPSVVKTQSGNVEGIIRTPGGGTSADAGGGGSGGGGAGGSTDMGYTQRQDLPYNNSGQAARRISWRELNGQ